MGNESRHWRVYDQRHKYSFSWRLPLPEKTIRAWCRKPRAIYSPTASSRRRSRSSARRNSAKQATRVLDLPSGSREAEVWTALRARIEQVNQAYQNLAAAKRPCPDQPPADIDALEDLCRELECPLKRLLHAMNRSALCLSGGGIRSASYGLGVLEGLAGFSLGKLSDDQVQPSEPASGLLHKLDYLSTVSGGGYIGSWLSAWIYRRQEAAVSPERKSLRDARKQLDSVATWRKKSTDSAAQLAQANVAAASQALSRSRIASLKSCYSTVVAALAGTTATTSGDPAPLTVRHLREYTSYLAPSLGLSLDSWTLGAIYLRNLFVNWLMLLPILLAAVALPQFTYYGSQALAMLPGSDSGKYLLGATVALALFLVAGFFAGYELPSRRTGDPAGPEPLEVSKWFVIPVMLANWTLVELWWSYSRGEHQPFRTMLVVCAVLAMSLIGLWLLCWKLFKKDVELLQASAHRDLAEGWNRVSRFLYIFFVWSCRRAGGHRNGRAVECENLSRLSRGDYIFAVYRKPIFLLGTTTPAPVDPFKFCKNAM